jgi:hypothetical protein
MVIGTNLWLWEQKQMFVGTKDIWLGNKKYMVVVTKTYACGTNLWL